MKSIHTLKADIYDQIKLRNDWFNPELAKEYSDDVAKRLSAQLGAREKAPTLRLSQMGPRCPKALWASIHKTDEAEDLPPWALIKYSYGHMIEALAIALAKASGHSVVGEQDEVIVDGVVGHRDCIIDGCLVDVKSCTSLGFAKYEQGTLWQDDAFGYLDQLDGYFVGSREDSLLTNHEKGYILAIDKNLGKIALYEHQFRESSIKARIESYKRIVECSTPPVCTCGTKPFGKSGNIGLDTKASYSVYKHYCFPHLRTFLYSDGPAYLTKVVRKPEVTEVDRYGKVIYRDY